MHEQFRFPQPPSLPSRCTLNRRSNDRIDTKRQNRVRCISNEVLGRVQPVDRLALPADPAELAQWLIGKILVRSVHRTMLTGRIVETEAYLPNDPASHSFRGRSPRNAAMFMERGHAYVYLIYGMWRCLNVTAGKEGEGAAVLLRALEPGKGVEAMSKRRPRASMRDLLRGPARLCTALDIGLEHNGVDLCAAADGLWLAAGERPPRAIGVSARIGITKAADARLRFYERGNPHVSGPASLRV